MESGGKAQLMDAFWSMYNKQDKLRIDDLKTEHVRIILLSIPTSRMQDWYLCREGDIHWHPVTDVPDFFEDVRALKGENSEAKEKPEQPTNRKPKGRPRVGTPKAEASEDNTNLLLKRKPSSSRRPLFEEAAQEDLQTKTRLKVITSVIKERRSARRYSRSVLFMVEQGSQAFSSQTRDISLSGLALENKLPTGLPKTFRASLHYKEQSVGVLCARVSANKIKILEADNWNVIRKWIVNG